VAIKHNLYENIGDINVYIEFEILKVKVPIIFLGTVGFSPLREGRESLHFFEPEDLGIRCD
jgi:hypothetical protein